MSKFTSALAGLAFVFGVSATAANAITTIDFDTIVTSGLDSSFNPRATFVGQTGSGSITFDETLGLPEYADGDLDFTLTMFGQTFASSDDEFGTAIYDPLFGDLFFGVSEVALLNPVAIALNGVESFLFSSAITPLLSGGNQITVEVFEGDGTCTTNCNLAPIPVPAALPLALMGFGLMGWVARGRVAA